MTRPRRRRSRVVRPRVLLGAGAGVVAAVVAMMAFLGTGPERRDAHPLSLSTASGEVEAGGRTDENLPSAETTPVEITDAALIARLPRLRFDTVVAGLLAEDSPTLRSDRVFTLAADAVVYGVDREAPVAVVPALDFLGDATVIVPVETDGAWVRILTPARQSLPSANGGSAPAQTSAWIPADQLRSSHATPHRIEVSISAQTLTVLRGTVIEATFPVGVGTPSTPTPTGVTGYLQARYLDPNQGQSVHRVQLTSLHSTHADEPYGGDDGGLIGLHFAEDAAGAVSHGCIRLTADAVTAVDALPLGTTISIVS